MTSTAIETLSRAARRASIPALVALLVSFAGCGGDGGDEFDRFKGSSADPAALQAAIAAFRASLGNNNGVGGSFAAGRREINWDGVPVAFEDPFPANFFNSNSARGVAFSTPGSRLKVSGAANTPSFLFADVTAQRWGLIEFAAFSPDKFFAAIGSTEVGVTFFVPGTATRATTAGFGAVFTDVDLTNSTRIDYYDARDQLITQQFVEPSGIRSKGFSFAGIVTHPARPIARVRIIAGSKPVDSPFEDPPPDGVAIDDLIFGEPQILR